MLPINVTNQTMNWQSQALYNPNCIMEMAKYDKFCENFRIGIIDNMTTRFKIGVIILIILIILRFILEYSKYSENDTIQFILRRINFTIIVTVICIIALLFV